LPSKKPTGLRPSFFIISVHKSHPWFVCSQPLRPSGKTVSNFAKKIRKFPKRFGLPRVGDFLFIMIRFASSPFCLVAKNSTRHAFWRKYFHASTRSEPFLERLPGFFASPIRFRKTTHPNFHAPLCHS